MMNPKRTRTIATVAILAGLMLLLRPVSAIKSSESNVHNGPVQNAASAYQESGFPQNDGEISAISNITSLSPTCTRPVENTGACYVNWYYHYVSADPSYINYLSIKIDGRWVAYHRGFFQQSMTIFGNMYGKGFRVNCGLPGSGGNPDFGKVYNYEIRAIAVDGTSAVNFGSVTCPFDVVKVYLPSIRR